MNGLQMQSRRYIWLLVVGTWILKDLEAAKPQDTDSLPPRGKIWKPILTGPPSRTLDLGQRETRLQLRLRLQALGGSGAVSEKIAYGAG